MEIQEECIMYHNKLLTNHDPNKNKYGKEKEKYIEFARYNDFMSANLT